MGFPLPSIQHLESAVEQMEMELYHDDDSSCAASYAPKDFGRRGSSSPRSTITTTWWTSPIPHLTSRKTTITTTRCQQQQQPPIRRCVTFRDDLITQIHERPKTTPDEREELFYSSDDVKRFRREYKMFMTMQRQRWMLAQQRQRQQPLQFYSIPTTQLLDSASSTVSQWLTSVTQLLATSTTTTTTSNESSHLLTLPQHHQSAGASPLYATTATTTTTLTTTSPSSCCHTEVANTISEPNMFLIDTLYLF